MKNLILSSVFVLIASSAAHAQQAVQWKVSDGGNGHWYAGIPIDGGADWHTAQALALATGGALACLESVAEFNEIVPPIAANPQLWIQRGNWWRGPWIGGLQDASDPSFSEPAGGWRWISGDVISPDLLATIGNGNPNNFPCCEDRLQIGENYLEPFVNDVPASTSSLGMIVEWSADCNNDGIVDYGQCRDGTLPDYDGDNIPDCCESGTTCVVGSYPVQWRVAEGGNGHWYKIRPKVGDWHACRSAALAAGADLASPSTSAENLFVERFVPSPSGSSLNRVFIGGRQAPGSSPTVGWYWIDGSDWDYTDWQFNQPNGNEGYLAVFVHGATVVWGDYVADSIDLCCFLVEWSADCNNDGVVDYGQILQGQLVDADANGVPDVCEVDPCPGDITNGGTVDAADLSILLAAWGTNGQAEFDTDIDGSGLVDGGDLALVLGGWGPCPQ